MLAGEVLFAEVLVTPTGVSKGCGYVILVYPLYGVLTNLFRIVEFASPEDAQRSVRELSEQSLLGRPVFIREVRTLAISVAYSTNTHLRTAKMSLALVLRPSRVRWAWPWRVKG